MYERSAIVLEKYFNNILGLNKKINLQIVFDNYKELVEKTKQYQEIIENEDKIIEEFDATAKDITKIQQEQKKIYKSNAKFEEERNQLFDNLEDALEDIEKRLKKIETNIANNNIKLEELRESFIKSLTIFTQKQSERNKHSRTRRTVEKEHMQVLEKNNNCLENITNEMLVNIKEFIKPENDEIKNEIIEKMINNGKGERVPFNPDVIERAVQVKIEITRKIAECYINCYDKTKKLLTEINNEEVRLTKYEKILKDITVKLAYLNAENNYIVSFLDNERMTAINGKKVHEKLMAEACENFDADIEQFNNLYELILKEVSGKSTKKAYNELYNKQYLKNIEEKEKNFEKEANNIKINAATIINSNYWRIEEIKNIYEVFQKEITEKFEKDLSEFELEKSEEIQEVSEIEEDDDIFKKNIDEDEDEFVEEYEENEEDYEDNDDEDNEEEYEDDDDKYDDYENDKEEYEDDDEYDEYEEDDDDEYYEEDDDDEYYEDDEDEDEDEDEDKEKDKVKESDGIKIEEVKKQNKRIFDKLFKDKK